MAGDRRGSERRGCERRGGGASLVRCGPVHRLAPQFGGAHGEHRLHRVVELAHAGEAGGESNLSHGHRCGLYEDTCSLCSLRAGKAQRTGADFRHEEALYLAGAVTETARKPADAVAVDDPISDKAHSTRNQICSAVPFRRTGRSVGPAAFAGTEARSLASCGGGVKGDVG